MALYSSFDGVVSRRVESESTFQGETLSGSRFYTSQTHASVVGNFFEKPLRCVTAGIVGGKILL